MNKIYILLFFAFLSSTITAQNVGIGTNDPKVKLDINGSLALREGPAITLANGGASGGTNDNIVLPDITSGVKAGFYRIVGPTAAFSVFGIVPTTGADGQLVTLVNTTNNPMTIKNNASSVAANGFKTLTGSDMVSVAGNSSITIQYNKTESRWYVTGSQNYVVTTGSIATGDITTANSAITLTNNTGRLVGTGTMTVDVQNNELNKKGLVPGPTGGNGNQVWGTDAGGNPAWQKVNNSQLYNSSITVNNGAGVSVSGSPVALGGTVTVTNTAPDQTVVLNNGAGISATGTYPNFTIANTGDLSATNEAQTIAGAGTSDISLSQAGGAGGGTITLQGTGATTVTRSGNTFTINSSNSGGTVTAVTASNGLNATGGATPDIKLGGTLATNTDVALNSKNLSFSGAGNVSVGTTSTPGTLSVNGTAVIGSGLVSRAAIGATISTSSATAFAANTDIGDGSRQFSIVNENATANSMATLSMRTNANGGANNQMVDVKLVNPNDGTSKLNYTFISGATPADRFAMTSAGFMGIGHATPQHQLSVGTVSSDGQGITIRGYSNSPTSWKGGGAFGYSSASVIVGELNGAAQIGGHNATLTGWANLLLNSAAGNVGVGTTAPLGKFSVGAGSLTDASLQVQMSTGGAGTESYYAVNKNGAYGLLMGYVNGTGLGTKSVIRNVSADPLSFYVNNTTEAMTILSNANVGVGMSPGNKLDVNGTAGVNYLTVRPQDGANEGGEIQLQGAGSNTTLQFDNFAGNVRIHTLAAGKVFEVVGGSGVKATGAQFTNLGGGGTRMVTTDNTGNLGVQTIPGGVLPAGSTGQTLYNTGGVWTATTNLSNDGSTIGLGSFTNADVDEWPKVQWLRVGTYDEGLIKGSSSRGVWGRAGFGIHMNADKHFGFFSSGWDPLFDVEGGTGRTYVKGNMGLGTNAPSGKLHVATNHANGVFQDANDRPSIGVTGVYPQMVLMSGNSGNVNHGATVMLGGFDAGASGAHKHWSIGTSGQNSSFLDIGFSSDLNPHGGIRNYSGTTVLTLTNGGLMGLGTLSPSQKLDVAGNVTANIYYDRDNTAYYANPNGYSSFNQLNVSRDGAGECCSGGNYTLSIAESTSGTGRLATIQFHNGGASEGYLRLANSGAYRRFQLGDYQSQGMGIELTGRITFDGTGPNGYRVEIPNIGNATGRYLGNDYYLYSSNRWKQDIKTIENPLDKIRTLRGVEYNLTKEHGGTHASGFIAEELGKSLPHLADYEEDGVSVKAVSYMGVIPYVVEGVKALDMNQSTQSEKLLELQKRLEEQNALIELMRKELEELKKK